MTPQYEYVLNIRIERCIKLCGFCLYIIIIDGLKNVEKRFYIDFHYLMMTHRKISYIIRYVRNANRTGCKTH